MKVNKEGFRIILTSALIFAALSAIVFILAGTIAGTAAAVALAIFLLFIISFFREPTRSHIEDEDIVYSPADGRIVVIENVQETEYFGEKRLQVSVFMSVLNVHVNWYPVGGRVDYFKYHPGKFLVAWHPKSSQDNERTTTVVDTGRDKILFRQIAGYVARRIVSYAEVGTTVRQNEKVGFIKFGSRIDLLLPLDSEVLVEMDQKVTGSITPIARLKKH